MVRILIIWNHYYHFQKKLFLMKLTTGYMHPLAHTLHLAILFGIKLTNLNFSYMAIKYWVKNLYIAQLLSMLIPTLLAHQLLYTFAIDNIFQKQNA